MFDRDYSEYPAWEYFLKEYEIFFNQEKFSELFEKLKDKFSLKELPEKDPELEEVIRLEQQYNCKLKSQNEKRVQENAYNKKREEHHALQNNNLIQQLSIWTPENIVALCIFYLESALFDFKQIYNEKFNNGFDKEPVKKQLNDRYEGNEAKLDFSLKLLNINLDEWEISSKEFSFKKLADSLYSEFIKPMLNFLENKRNELGMEQMMASDSVNALKKFHTVVKKFTKSNITSALHENNINQPGMPIFNPVSEDEIKEKKAELNRATAEAKRIQDRRLSAWQAISNIPHNINNYVSIGTLNNNEYLQMALSASYIYYTNKNKGLLYYHGDDGKKATEIFVDAILANPSKANIQNEALDYIKGVGKYKVSCFSGGSGYHKSSRIAFIIDSGLLDDREEEIKKIYKQPATTNVHFFNPHKRTAFDKLMTDNGRDARIDVTNAVKSLTYVI